MLQKKFDSFCQNAEKYSAKTPKRVDSFLVITHSFIREVPQYLEGDPVTQLGFSLSILYLRLTMALLFIGKIET